MDQAAGRSTFARLLAESAASSRITHCARVSVGMMADGTPGGHGWARRGHKVAQAMLESCAATTVRWLCTGGGVRSPVQGPPADAARDRARASLAAASRSRPLSFGSDLRGSFRSLYDAIITASAEHTVPAMTSVFYTGDDLAVSGVSAGPSVPFVASSLSIPEKAAVVELSS